MLRHLLVDGNSTVETAILELLASSAETNLEGWSMLLLSLISLISWLGTMNIAEAVIRTRVHNHDDAIIQKLGLYVDH